MAVPIEEKQTFEKATTTATATAKSPENTTSTVPEEDPRFAEVKSEENRTLTEMENTYDDMIEGSDKFFDKQIDATENWGDKQAQLQQEQTDFVVDKIEQQKDQAQKDYVKEQSGAYVDWQKQSNPYGADAERKASNGLTNTGYSESSQVAMYNAYQNRVATARESLNKANLEYDNAIKEAMLQNNAALAEIAFTTLQQKLQLSLQGFQYKNELVLDKFNTKLQIKQHYDNQWQNVLDNIYREQSFGLQKDQFEYGKAQDTKNNALNLILSGIGNEQLYKEAGLSFELGEALKNSFVSDREKLNLDLADQKLALEREDAGTLLTLAQMGIKVPLTEGLKKMGITQSMLDSIINMGSTSSVSSGGGSGNYEDMIYQAPDEEQGIEEGEVTSPTSNGTVISGSTTHTSSSGRTHSGGGGSFGNSDSAKFPSYDELVAFMIEEGVPKSKAKKMMTKSEWGRSRKAEGTTKDQAKGTYEEYVANYIDNCLK